jgi:hypothetical protein
VTTPELILVATPQVGEKEVSYASITDWIAEKLKQEFQVRFFSNHFHFLNLSISIHIINITESVGLS